MWFRSADALGLSTKGPALPALFASLLGVAASPAFAGDIALAVRGDTLAYDAAEHFDSGAVANAERGQVRGQELEWSDGDAKRRIHLRWSRAAGTVQYVGSSQVGLPVATSTALRWSDVAAGVTAWPLRAERWRAGLGASLGQRQLLRAIRPTFFSTPLTETMRQQYLHAALHAAWSPVERVELAAFAGADRALRSSLHADFHGAADPARVWPAPRWSGTYGVSLAAQLGPDWSVEWSWRRQDLRFGGSAPADYRIGGQSTGSTVRYPGSTQQLDQTLIGVAWHWR